MHRSSLVFVTLSALALGALGANAQQGASSSASQKGVNIRVRLWSLNRLSSVRPSLVIGGSRPILA